MTPDLLVGGERPRRPEARDPGPLGRDRGDRVDDKVFGDEVIGPEPGEREELVIFDGEGQRHPIAPDRPV
ncbi:MAG: hypothetical protein C4343_03710 [Chloroflexota bacterium]